MIVRFIGEFPCISVDLGKPELSPDKREVGNPPRTRRIEELLPPLLPLFDAVFPLLNPGRFRHHSRQVRQIVQSSKDLRRFLP